MIINITAYIKTIVALTIFSSMANILISDNEFKKYIELVMGFLILSTVLTPLLNLINIQ